MPEDLRRKIMEEEDMEKLKKWSRLAARVMSVEDVSGALPGEIVSGKKRASGACKRLPEADMFTVQTHYR